MSNFLPPPGPHERRWRPALAIIVAIVLVGSLPDRMRTLPAWFAYVLVIATLVPMAGIGLAPKTRAFWLRAERATILLVFVAVQIGVTTTLFRLIEGMISSSSGISGVKLLESAVVAWVNNVISYSLLYWIIDRGGPEARKGGAGIKPDWLFAQDQARDQVRADWRPTFPDYLFLAFTTATAFSPTDALPLTTRAKMLMLAQSTTALVTIVMVASRAINIIGT